MGGMMLANMNCNIHDQVREGVAASSCPSLHFLPCLFQRALKVGGVSVYELHK